VTDQAAWRSPLPDGFRWPDGARAAACLTFDVDAESAILFEHPESAAWLDVMSHQAYGARTGIARLLRMLDRRRVKATFFTVGKALDARPDISRALLDDGALAPGPNHQNPPCRHFPECACSSVRN